MANVWFGTDNAGRWFCLRPSDCVVVQSWSLPSNKPLVPTRNGEAQLLAAHAGR
jgi:hypothetical protein